MYKCTDCGHLFENGEQKTIRENMGEFWGSPAYEEKTVCPLCEGDYEEIEPCKICGGYESLETYEEVCEDCKRDILKRYKDLICANFSEVEKELLDELLKESD